MTERGWQGRPRWAAAVQGLVVAVPLAAGVGAAVVFAHLVPRPSGAVRALSWWMASFGVSTASVLLVGQQARRLLPLATLLKLSMVFPDKTPSRFSVALRAGTVGNLKHRVEQLRHHGVETEAGAAAETIMVLAAAMNAHDRSTRGHAERVRALTELLADELGLSPEDQDRLRWSSLLHDVGKVMVDPAILNKAGPLDEHEWAAIHRHPDDGARIAAPLRKWLGDWALAIEQHHEKFDGSGYPRKLAGEQISSAARIVAVADAYEVMTSPRTYKEAMTTAAARQELADGAGTHFDPSVVRAFLSISIGRLKWAMGPLAWLVQLPLVRALPTAGSGAAAAAGGAAAILSSVALGLAPAVPPAVSTAPGGPYIAAAGAPAAKAPVAPAMPPPPPAPLPAGPSPRPTAVPVTAAPVATTLPNRPPLAVDDQAATQSRPSKPVKIDVVGNDSDPDGDLRSGTVTIVSPPTRGKANPGTDGTVNYVPDNEAVGGDQFVYRVCDAAGSCDTATVTVTF